MTPSLETLLDLAEAHCRGETLTERELAGRSGVQRNAARCRVATLLRKGLVTRDPGHRRLRLTDAGWAALVPYCAQDPRWLFIPVAQLRKFLSHTGGKN